MQKNNKTIGAGRQLADFPGLVLASQSPRRKAILAEHGFTPTILPADIVENITPDMDPYDATMFLSLKKALHIQKEHPELEGQLIMASDTVVCQNGQIMGKPHSREEAYQMIKGIQNAVHLVVTGVTLLEAGKENTRTFYEVTEVHCNEMAEDEIRAYIATEEPYDKAGGYAIQGTFGAYIDHIVGDYENVVGLPYDRMVTEAAML